MQDNLFQTGDFKLHSGRKSIFKINCDALTDEDIETLAMIIHKKVGPFCYVYGVPTGGTRLKYALDKYVDSNSKTYLIVDDVLSSGASMKEGRGMFYQIVGTNDVKGVVIFARGKCPDWVTPIFQMWEDNI